MNAIRCFISNKCFRLTSTRQHGAPTCKAVIPWRAQMPRWKMEKEEVLQQNLRTSVEQVTNAINSWKLSYCLYAPIAGKVSFTTYWNENQYIPSGDTVCTIVPESRSRLMGKAHREGELVNSSRFFLKNSLHEEYFPQTLF